MGFEIHFFGELFTIPSRPMIELQFPIQYFRVIHAFKIQMQVQMQVYKADADADTDAECRDSNKQIQLIRKDLCFGPIMYGIVIS